MKVKEYYEKNFQFSSGGVAGKDYRTFEKQCKKEVKQMAEEAGFTLHKFNPMHYEWTAVLERDGKFVYVHMSDVRFWGNDWYNDILIRTMAHESDWRGGHNNKCSFNQIGVVADRISK